MTTTGKTFIIQSKWNGFVLDQTPNSDQGPLILHLLLTTYLTAATVTCYPFNGGPNQIVRMQTDRYFRPHSAFVNLVDRR